MSETLASNRWALEEIIPSFRCNNLGKHKPTSDDKSVGGKLGSNHKVEGSGSYI